MSRLSLTNSRFIRWSFLRSIGNSRAVQLSSFFPLLGYLILLNDDLARALHLAPLSVAHEGIGFMERIWHLRLHFVYFGLMSFGIGALLYHAFCPNLIKRHGSGIELVRSDMSAMSFSQIQSIADMLGKFVPYSDTEKIDLISDFYQWLDTSSPIARSLVFLAFALGTLLLAAPSALTASRIVLRLFE